MTDKEIKELILEFQEKGFGDYKVAKEIGWTRDQVRNFRLKHDIKQLEKECIVCKEPINKKGNTKYCSDDCRIYHNIQRKALKDVEVLKRWKA